MWICVGQRALPQGSWRSWVGVACLMTPAFWGPEKGHMTSEETEME